MKRKIISTLLILCICLITPISMLNSDTHNEQNVISCYNDDKTPDVVEK